MSLKLYQLYCEICGWKRITDGSDISDLYEIKCADMPTGAPKYDTLEKKTVVPPLKKRLRKFRCQKCGRGVVPRKIQNPQAELDAKLEKERMQEQRELERQEEQERIAALQAEDMAHDKEAEKKREAQRRLEAEEKLKQYSDE